MPRGAREKSETGIYHVILRGTNRQEVFHDDEDRIRYLDTLKRYKDISGMKVYGWCLMGNHIHLLLEEDREELSLTMKRIGVSYVWYYNYKYNTLGHLFQDRFRSEKVNSDKYLLTVIRYIHQNPIKANMVKKLEEWKWSSYSQYYITKSHTQGLLDKDLILGLFSEGQNTAVIKFKEYNQTENDDICLEDKKRVRLTDEEAKKEIQEILPPLEWVQIKSMPKPERNEIIKEMKRIEGISQRQLAKILGIPPSLVFKA